MAQALLLSNALAYTTLGEADPGGKADGPMFWRPAISIPTGIPGHVVQHVTTTGLGAAGCHRPPCEQIPGLQNLGAETAFCPPEKNEL